jgi:archaellum component FlaC
MSEDPTLKMGADTKPTIETLLERLNTLVEEMRKGFTSVEQKLERIEIRLDRVESMALETRADFKEFRTHLKETVPK